VENKPDGNDVDLEAELRKVLDEALEIQSWTYELRVSVLHALSILEGARQQEAATKRLASTTTWLVVATFVLAAATIVLVVVTAGA
jgi:hypothetical protein